MINQPLRGPTRSAFRLIALAVGVLAFAAGAGWHTSAPAASSVGLVAAYSFDEGTGGSVADASGSGNSGTVLGATWSTAGKDGGALSFNGSSSSVTIPDSSALDLTSGMTLEAWVNPSALGTGWRTAVLKEQPNAGELTYALYANTDTTQPATNVFSGSDQFTSGGSLPLNAWSFLASTYDGTTLRLFVNGSQVASKTIGGAIATSTAPLRIGGNSIWGEWFQGRIDNVRVYNRPLDVTEIQSDMGTAVAISTAAKTVAPVAAYSFDEGTGTTVGDASGTGNVGATSNTTWSTAGKYGGALSFNGSNGSVTVKDSASLDLTTGMTLEAWVDPSALGGGWRTALVKEQSPPNELNYALYANTDTGQPAANVFSGGDQFIRAGSVPVNSWSFLAATYDGTTLRLYLNGNQVTSRAIGGQIATSGGPLRIGGNAIWGEWFQGLIDNVRVYNRALSANQIQNDMSTPVGSTAAPPPPPPPPPSGDTQPPTTPTGLTTSGATQSSLSASWAASTDDTGVAGYDVMLNGPRVSTTAGLSFTFSGLACGTTYTVAVDAFDAAGNRSGQTSRSAATSACSTSSASVFVSASGSDSNPCTQSAPCQTLNRGYQDAQAGQTVQVAGGTYPAQTILRDSSKASGPDVVIQSAPGATVTITGRLYLGTGGAGNAPSHLVLRNLTAPKKRVGVFDPSTFVTLDNLSAGSFFIDGAQNLTISGGDYGNCGTQDSACEGGGAGSQNWIRDDVGTRTNNVLVDGVTIHDYFIQSSADHYECLFVLGGTNITIQNSHFYRCEIYDIFLQANGPRAISGVTIQNNWFGRTMNFPNGTLRGSAVVLGQHVESQPLSDVLIRYNSFAGSEAIVDEGFDFGAYTNVRAIGNIIGVDGGDTTNPTGGGGFTNCVPQVFYDYNVWRSGACGSHSTNLGGTMPYVNGSDVDTGDYHLAGASGSTRADGWVTPTSGDYALGTDVDGQTRTAPRDAGSDQR